MSTWQGFDDRKAAEAYAIETGMDLGRRRPEPHLKRAGLPKYFVGRFSAYHYDTIEPREQKRKKVSPGA